MKVFILMQYSCDNDSIINVYLDETKAQTQADWLNSEDNPDYYVNDYAYVEFPRGGRMKPMAKRNPTKYQQRRRVFLVYLPAAWVVIAFVCWGLAWLIKNAPL